MGQTNDFENTEYLVFLLIIVSVLRTLSMLGGRLDSGVHPGCPLEPPETMKKPWRPGPHPPRRSGSLGWGPQVFSKLLRGFEWVARVENR